MLELYRNIKHLREEKGLSQDELARLTGYTSRSSIAKIEKGEVDLQQSKILAFAKALGTTPGKLMGLTESDYTHAPTANYNEEESNITDVYVPGTVLTPRDEKDIEKIIEHTREQLLSQEGLMFDGDPASPEAVDSILAAMQIGMEMAKKKNKEKYTPKKYLSNIDKKQE